MQKWLNPRGTFLMQFSLHQYRWQIKIKYLKKTSLTDKKKKIYEIYFKLKLVIKAELFSLRLWKYSKVCECVYFSFWLFWHINSNMTFPTACCKCLGRKAPFVRNWSEFWTLLDERNTITLPITSHTSHSEDRAQSYHVESASSKRALPLGASTGQ